MDKTQYRKVKGQKGIYKHIKTGNIYLEKTIKGTAYRETFKNLYEALKWVKECKSSTEETKPANKINTSTLMVVWEKMQEQHFPTLATSTINIWLRRFKLLESLKRFPMEQITPHKITEWVNHWVTYFKSEEYQSSGRGKAGRCNLNNELNLFVTIFNWYKESEVFEEEARNLQCPIRKKHRVMGFINPLPVKKKQISLEDAFLFFQYLQPLYRLIAMMQFYIAGRVGETAGLLWSNICLDNRRLIVKETIIWDSSSKMFLELKPFPKNKEPRVCYITDEMMDLLNQLKAFRHPGCDFVFNIEGKPLNYGTIQINYRGAQRKSGVPYSGTHILRHGMAKLARKVGGGLDAVMAMTGHKDIKLADHYSKCDEDDQKEMSILVMKHIREQKNPTLNNDENKVITLSSFKRKQSNGTQ